MNQTFYGSIENRLHLLVSGTKWIKRKNLLNTPDNECVLIRYDAIPNIPIKEHRVVFKYPSKKTNSNGSLDSFLGCFKREDEVEIGRVNSNRKRDNDASIVSLELRIGHVENYLRQLGFKKLNET